MPRVSRFAVEFSIPSDTHADGRAKVWLAEFTHRHAKESCPHLSGGHEGTPIHVRMQCSHHDTKGRPLHPQLQDCTEVRLRKFCPSPVVAPINYRVDAGPDAGKFVPIRHLTSVKLRHKGETVFLSGHAPCSIRDTYNWRHGIHYSIQRALEKAGYCKLGKDPVSHRIVVQSKKPIYDEIMDAFYREMAVSVAPPSSGDSSEMLVVEGVVLSKAEVGATSTRALETLSTRRAHGMGYSEAPYEHFSSTPEGRAYVAAIPPENKSGTAYAGMD